MNLYLMILLLITIPQFLCNVPFEKLRQRKNQLRQKRKLYWLNLDQQVDFVREKRLNVVVAYQVDAYISAKWVKRRKNKYVLALIMTKYPSC